jgi:hypothetical protein
VKTLGSEPGDACKESSTIVETVQNGVQARGTVSFRSLTDLETESFSGSLLLSGALGLDYNPGSTKGGP